VRHLVNLMINFAKRQVYIGHVVEQEEKAAPVHRLCPSCWSGSGAFRTVGSILDYGTSRPLDVHARVRGPPCLLVEESAIRKLAMSPMARPG
jgi:hypothetical protein